MPNNPITLDTIKSIESIARNATDMEFKADFCVTKNRHAYNKILSDSEIKIDGSDQIFKFKDILVIHINKKLM